ncbi:MAG TPA: amino acid adenylation domain-containing protein, partial [Thermoanaerobaculia bacterium]|nr:amino acid adenylation domain-containing protein [Thermoanaerobaculia bacterium]
MIGRDLPNSLDFVISAGQEVEGEPAGSLAPLSHGQRSLWFLHHLAPVGGAYNIAAAARVCTPVDAGALERAFQALVDRHESLRTTFPAVGGEPCRQVAAGLGFALACEDAAGWSEERLRSRLAEEAWRPFDLGSGPLLRVTLLTGDPAGPVILLVIHHIVADFWSLAILMRELPALYREAAGGEPAELSPPGLSYHEHVRLEEAALAGERGEGLLDYWKETLAGLPTLELATDRPRPAVQAYRGDIHRLRLPGGLAAALRARSRAQHGTLFMTLTAAFQALLSRHTGQEDLAVGAPRSGRSQSRLAGTVGYFVNPVVLRGDLSGDPAFGELLERTKAAVLAAFEHGDYPLPLLAEHLQPVRDASRTPLFQVSFVMQKETRGVEGLTAFALGEEGVAVGPEGFRLESLALDRPPAPFDLMLHAVERQGGLSFALQYNADLYDATTAERLMERFAVLLGPIAESPDLALSALPVLPEAELLQLVAWNDTAGPVQESSLYELFEARAERSQDEVAVVFEEEDVTYRELVSRASALARHLAGLGVGPEVVVGVAAERSVEMVVGLLGVLGAGGAYLPLEPSLPRQRLAMILSDARPSVLLVQRSQAGALPLDDFPETRLVWLDDAARFPPATGPLPRPSPDNAAYVIYTSGSTGRPKGVVNTHRGILNRLLWMQETFGLDASERFLQKTPFGFDVSVPEFFAPLILGARLVVARPEGHRDSAYLVQLVRQQGITNLHFVPSMLPFFLAEEGVATCRSLRRVLVSGEAVPWEVEQRCLEVLPVPLVNLYGPTEAAVEVTAWVCQPAARPRPVPIGRPIRNTQIRVVGRLLEPVPVGGVGELAIGGVQVARGYLGRPDLTAERFVPDPYSTTPGARLYRTGDLCRHLRGGEIEYLGRLDDQVKIRGFRIEPREIEIALAAQSWVREAAVVVRQDGAEKSLLACVVLSEAEPAPATAAALRDFLAARLPSYMVPAFAFGAALDRLPNGKLDRRSLSRWTPTAEAARAAVLPRTPLEELLAGLFAEVLGVERIGVEDSFFEHGGHSLAVMRLIARVREAFGADLPLHRVFETPTVAALARAIEEAGRSEAPPLVPVPRDVPLPLSFAQQRLWFLHQLEPGSPVYNMPAAVHLTGWLNHAVLAAALGEVARRHESLRTRFVTAPGGPVQIVDPPAPFPLPAIDLAGLPAEPRLGEARRLAREEALRSFDLTRGPLLRASLIGLAEEESLLLLTLHHIVSDGWSLRLLAHELGEHYGAFSHGRPSPLPALEIQYGDYAVWQRGWLAGERLEAEIAHWRARLAGASPVLDLPLDRPRPAVMSDRGASHALELPPALLPGLRALARRQGVTLFMAVLAAFQALLSRVSHAEDVSVGTPVAGRGQLRTEGLIGFFVNTLVMRTGLSGEPSFAALLARVREVALSAYSHQDLPFEKLVEELQPRRDLSYSPLFQVSFTLDGEPPPSLRLGNLAAVLWPLEQEMEKFDLSLTLGVKEEGLSGALSFRTGLFEGSTIERLAGHFTRLLAGAVEEPGLRLGELPLLSEAERGQLLAWNAAEAAGPETTLTALWEAQVARAPEAPAASFEGETLSYGELNRRANRLARHLRRLGVGPEVRVGMLCERSLEMVAGLLAILKAGGAYVPLDPSAPAERLAFFCRDSGLRVLVTDGREELPPAQIVVRLGAAEEALADEDDRDLETLAGPDNLCYVIYTSGSTGTPKGVLVRHGSVARLLSSSERWFGFGPGDVWTLFHSYSFDFSVWELWGALAYGGRLVMVPYWVSRSPEAFWRLLVEERVTVLNQTPSAFRPLIQADGEAPAADRERLALRLVIFGGEALDPASLRPWSERHALDAPRLVNMYGITETTVHVSYRPLSASDLEDSHRSPIGEALPALGLRLLGPGLDLVPVGVPGEICVGGAGLARGYLGRPELTAERFVPDPFGEEPGARLYRSGDLARYRPDGQLDYLGRRDQQVKVRGFRIEPGEVEAVLLAHPAVRSAVVLLRQDLSGGGALVAYLETAEGAVSAAELRELSKARLPEYMVPSAYVCVEALPLTGNGKLDRRALAALPLEGTEREGSGVPRTPAEELVAGIFEEVLGVERIGIGEDFFALGGHSLLATQVAARVRSVFGVELPVRAVFEAPTVASLAGRLGTPEAAPSPIARISREEPIPLSFAQQRLWFLDRLEPGSPLYSIPAAVELTGRMDRAALAAALSEVVRRHEALRTTFSEVAGEPVQVVGEPDVFALPLVDLQGVPAEEASRLATAEALRPFDLAHGPLLRAALLSLGAERHVLLVAMHHIVGDGWSMGVLVREVGALYAAFVAGHPSPLPELPVQYADFAAWQRRHLSGELLKTELAWWRERLAGMPPALDLPTDHPRPAERSPRGAVHEFEIEGDGLAGLSRRQGATLFMALLAGFAGLLARFTGEDDLVAGTPIAGRTRVETEPLIGVFVNTLALRVDLSGAPSFAEILGRVRETALAAYAHQELPFERLVEELAPERDRSRPPLVQVLFALQNAPAGPLSLPGLALAVSPIETGTAKLELACTLTETERGLAGTLEYSRDLFDLTTAERLASGLARLLEAAVASPGTRLAELPVLSPAELATLVFEWNNTVTSSAGEPRVHELVLACARRQPEALAVAAPGERHCYGELAARAGRLAGLLSRLGVGPEVRVALCAGPTVHRVVGSLAVLLAGGAYVPLDPEAPPERLAFLVADSGAAAVLTERALSGRFELCTVPLVELETEIEEESSFPLAPLAAVHPENLAYVVYTSGSIGLPKGVAVTHAGLSNLVSWHCAAYGLSPEDRATLIANPAFDASVWELWPCLAAGASIHIPGEETRLSPQEIVRFWRNEGITWSFLPTPLAEEVMAEGAAADGLVLKGLLCGGDRLHHAPDSSLPFALINHYGPSEVSVVSTAAAVSPETPGAPPIGRPIHNIRTYGVDALGALAPRGAAGELWIGGASLARGYLGRPDLTAELFVPDPWSGAAGERLYRTGDRVRYRPDGSLEFLGRIDHQIKLRGFRIEPGEIEAALCEHPAVAEALVEIRRGRLVAYIAGDAGERVPSGRELRERLGERLPGYMVPAAFVPLRALPLTPNGKLDRKALPDPGPEEGGEARAPRTPAEELLAGIFAEVLGLEKVGIAEDFFERGGHSLLATRVTSRVRSVFGVELPVRAVFETPTVEGLAARVEGSEPSPSPIVRISREEPVLLSFAQQRLWFLDQLEPGSPLYNIPVAVELTGRLEVPALAAALSEVTRRHEALRTTFPARAGEPVQGIAESAGLVIPVVDLRGVPEGEASRLAAAEARRPFDLAEGPLLRTALLQVESERHVLLLTMHHIVSDGWSLGVLVRELGALYAAFVAGHPSPLPELEIQYADFAAWQRGHLSGERLESELAWWRERLSGMPAALDLPTDHPRPAVQSGRGAVHEFVIEGEGLAGLSRRQGATLFMTLFAGFAGLLARFTGEDDLVVGTPIAGRTRVETEPLIGLFVNTLVLRADLVGDPALVELLDRVRETTLAAYAHQEVPFERLVEDLAPERDRSRPPLVQVLFALQNAPSGPLELPGLTLSASGVETGTAKFDLTCTLTETERGLAGTLEYSRDLFEPPTIERLAGHFTRLLAAAAA